MNTLPATSLSQALRSHGLRPGHVLGALVVVALGGALWANTMGRRVEEPSYRVVARDGAFEVREYAARVVAETRVSGAREVAANEGFRRIAGYIFGGNHRGEEVAMTAPVSQRAGERVAMTAPVTQRGDGAGWTVAFTMPAGRTRATLPTPDDPRVTLREVPVQRVAALRFAGRTDEGTVRRRVEELARWAEARGLRAEGAAELNRYDPPWTIPFLRRNEVWLALGA